MYLIKWRRPSGTVVLTGLSRYSTREEAEAQVAWWQLFFGNNYYVEKVSDYTSC